MPDDACSGQPEVAVQPVAVSAGLRGLLVGRPCPFSAGAVCVELGMMPPVESDVSR
jgi:hypothetical protein